jgi:membrane associated rhomboid family serine protease
MFIPIGDDQETRRIPVVNYALIGINLLVFLLCFPHPTESVLISYAVRPDHLRWPTLFTAMFLHANLMHVLGNMLFLWIFGRNVEDRLGHVIYALFYLVCGLAAWFLHIVSTSDPGVPALGASGAVSGAIGAYVVLNPRARIKMFIWIYFFADVFLIPAVVWIGLWFLEQIFFASSGVGGVAYLAHVGGFLAGAGLGGLTRLFEGVTGNRRSPPVENIDAPRPAEARRPFSSVATDTEIEFLDESFDRYSVVTLRDAAARAAELALIAAPLSGQPPDRIAARIEATRGVIVRGLPRAAAEQLRRELTGRGVPAALVADAPANLPPAPVPVEAASWDDRVLRLRAGNQIIPIPWPTPFLFVGAAAAGETFIDLFTGGRGGFRISDRPDVPLTRVDAARRSEESADLAGLARAILEARRGAGCNEGLAVLAQAGALGWLAFRSAADYDDYLFWTYNLARFQNSIPGA